MSIRKEVYYQLKNTTNFLKAELRKKIEEHGISWQQFHALYHIVDDGVKANDLAKELNCNASNMTGLIDRMIENNWVFREHSVSDRRVWLIKLTKEGYRLKNLLLPIHKENINEVMSVLSDEELDCLQKILIKLTKVKGE